MAQALLLILIPLLFQIIIGGCSIAKKISWHFGIITLISIASLLIVDYIAIKIVAEDMSAQGAKCGTPMVALFFAEGVLLIALLLVIVIQLVIKNRRKIVLLFRK